MTDDDPARFPRPDRTEPRGAFPDHRDPTLDRLHGRPLTPAVALARALSLRAAWRELHPYGD